MSEVTVTEDHKKLLQRMYIGWDDCEYGAPAVDCKRPYGNGDVEGDIAEILGWTPEGDDYEGLSREQRERAGALHREMQAVLQLVVKDWGTERQQIERLLQFVGDIRTALRPYDGTCYLDMEGRSMSEALAEVCDVMAAFDRSNQ